MIEVDIELPSYIKVGEPFTLRYTVTNPLDFDIEVFIRVFLGDTEVGRSSVYLEPGQTDSGEIVLTPYSSPYTIRIIGEAYSDGVLIAEGGIEVTLTEAAAGIPTPIRVIPLVIGAGMMAGGMYREYRQKV